MNFKLNTDGTMALKGGRFALVDGAEEVAQRLRVHFGFARGEWALDTTAGFPWQQVLAKNPNVAILRAVFATALASVEGVAKVRTLTLNYDPVLRALAVNFVVATVAGAVLQGDIVPPQAGAAPAFIIEVL